MKKATLDREIKELLFIRESSNYSKEQLKDLRKELGIEKAKLTREIKKLGESDFGRLDNVFSTLDSFREVDKRHEKEQSLADNKIVFNFNNRSIKVSKDYLARLKDPASWVLNQYKANTRKDIERAKEKGYDPRVVEGLENLLEASFVSDEDSDEDTGEDGYDIIVIADLNVLDITLL